jgi:signal transduction histidine kinase
VPTKASDLGASLAAVAERLRTASSRPEIMARTVQAVCAAFSAGCCAVYERRASTPDSLALVLSKSEGIVCAPVIPLAGTYLERCLAEAEPVCVEFAAAGAEEAALAVEGARAGAFVPFRAAGEPEAVLVLLYAAAHAFAEAELVALRCIASLAVCALERLRQGAADTQRRRRSDGLERTMLALRDAREVHDVLAIVARGLSHDFARPCAAYYIRDGVFRPIVASETKTVRKPISLDQLDLDALRVRPVLQLGGEPVLAVSSDGQLRALLVLEDSHAPLSEDDVKYLLSIGAYVALALTSALAFDQLRRYAAEGAALTDSARTILGFTELEPLAAALCGMAVRLVFGGAAGVYARRGDELACIGSTATDEHRRMPETLPADEREAREVLALAFEGAPFIATRLLLPGGGADDVHHGLLVVARPHGYAFARDEVRLIEALVTLAALAIRNVDLYEQSVHANRALAESNAFKDDLMAMFAHDFRGPLTVISGYCELLLETDDAELRQYILTMIEQTKRLSKLSEDALALAATQSAGFSLSRTPEDLTAFLRETMRTNGRHAERITFDAPAEPVVLAFDRSRLRHAIENVVGNALKYSTERVEVRVVPAPDEVRIEISDSGIGIPAADLERVFVRFGRATNARSRGISGSGVGLYIAKKIVEVHGGRLTVSSVEDEGSTFTIVLPREQEHLA